jgi:hypothetical protein
MLVETHSVGVYYPPEQYPHAEAIWISRLDGTRIERKYDEPVQRMLDSG